MLDCFIAYAIRNDVVTLKYCFRHCERSEAIYRIYRGNVYQNFFVILLISPQTQAEANH